VISDLSVIARAIGDRRRVDARGAGVIGESQHSWRGRGRTCRDTRRSTNPRPPSGHAGQQDNIFRRRKKQQRIFRKVWKDNIKKDYDQFNENTNWILGSY
jgi:hypothetical protein